MTATMQETMNVIRRFAPNFTPKAGLILGSGLGVLAEQLESPITIPYQAIPGLSQGNVQGHASLLVMGTMQGIPVVCLKGRLHLYEGAGYDAIRTLVRIVRQLGAHALLVTGAAGSLRAEVGPGEIMLVNDHISLHPGNPLSGPNDESVGPRFFTLENAYDRDYCDVFRKQAQKLGFALPEGVYISTLGPSFETPAEIRAYRTLGADAVGMSVVPEVIVARHCGLRVAGALAITNLAVGLSRTKVTHEETLRNAEICGRKLARLIPECIKEMALTDSSP